MIKTALFFGNFMNLKPTVNKVKGGVKSTSTAILSLSAVAATNASLAAPDSGALAAGMAGEQRL